MVPGLASVVAMRSAVQVTSVVIAAALLILLASVVRTHTCDVGCNPELDWARGIALAGGVAGVVSATAARREANADAMTAGWVACVGAYGVALALIFIGG